MTETRRPTKQKIFYSLSLYGNSFQTLGLEASRWGRCRETGCTHFQEEESTPSPGSLGVIGDCWEQGACQQWL